jgi:hypothetical protein
MPVAAPCFSIHLHCAVVLACAGLSPCLFLRPQHELASLASAFLHCLQAVLVRVQCLQNLETFTDCAERQIGVMMAVKVKVDLSMFTA